jgi:hypothetical protein
MHSIEARLLSNLLTTFSLASFDSSSELGWFSTHPFLSQPNRPRHYNGSLRVNKSEQRYSYYFKRVTNII